MTGEFEMVPYKNHLRTDWWTTSTKSWMLTSKTNNPHQRGGKKTDKKAYYSWANLVALVADVVSVSLHGKGCWILKESTPGSCDGITLVQPLVLQAHQSLASHVVIQLSERVQERAQHLVFYFTLHKVEQRNFTPRVLFHTAHSTTGRLWDTMSSITPCVLFHSAQSTTGKFCNTLCLRFSLYDGTLVDSICPADSRSCQEKTSQFTNGETSDRCGKTHNRELFQACRYHPACNWTRVRAHWFDKRLLQGAIRTSLQQWMFKIHHKKWRLFI